MSADALSLACNIITLIDFSHKFYETCRQISENGKPDHHVDQTVAELRLLSMSLQQSRAATSRKYPGNDQLLRIADQCLAASASYQAEVQKLIPPASSSRLARPWNVLASAAKRTWRQDRIQRLQKTFEDCQRTMETAILVDMHNSGQAAQMIREKDFEKLDLRLQNFVHGLSREQFQISTLLRDNQVLQQETKEEVVALRELIISENDLDRLKDSLKFEGFERRYASVSESHRRSFAWLLKDLVTQDDGQSFESSDSRYELSDSGYELSDSGSEARSPSEDDLELEPGFVRKACTDTRGDFSHWLTKEPGSRLYWVSGKPGTGKSTLMKFLCESLKTGNYLEGQVFVIHHFFWLGSAKRSLENDVEGMLRTILLQALEYRQSQAGSSLAAMLMDEFPARRKSPGGHWSIGELRVATLAALEILGRECSIYIVLDALDEHFPADDHETLLNLVDRMKELPYVRVILSSRREHIFERRLARSRQLRLERLTSWDIYHFALDLLKQKVEAVSIYISAGPFLEELAGEITRKAEGVFLLARLAVESVRRGMEHRNTEAALRERVNGMPRELSDFFKSIWQRLGDDEAYYRTKAANTFTLLLCNAWGDSNGYFRFGDLRLLELSLAISPVHAQALIDDGSQVPTETLLQLCQDCRDTILSHCAGLVEIEPKHVVDNCFGLARTYPDPGNTVTFVHRTAREFLLGTPQGKEILDSNDIGDQEAELRVWIGRVARMAAFRTSGHNARECELIRHIPIQNALSYMNPAMRRGGLSHPDRHRDRHRVLSACHTIYDRFCAPLENPRFAGWHLSRYFAPILPFVFLAAMEGHMDYAVSWIREQCSQTRPTSPELCDALVKEGLRRATLRKGGSMDDCFEFFRTSFLPVSDRPLENLDLLRYIADLNVRSPAIGLRDPWLDPNDHLPLSSTHRLISPAQLLITHFLHYPCHMTSASARYFLDIINSCSLLFDRVLCAYQFPSHMSPMSHGELLPFERITADKTEGGERYKRIAVLETTPAWVIQWSVSRQDALGSRQREENALPDYLLELMRELTSCGTRIAPPRVVMLLRSNTHCVNIIHAKDARAVSGQCADHLGEPLNSLFFDMGDWQEHHRAFTARVRHFWGDLFIDVDEESTEKGRGIYDHDADLNDKLEEILKKTLLDLGLLGSDEYVTRLATASGIRLPQGFGEGSYVGREVEGKQLGLYGRNQKFLFPPENCSPEDEQLSRLLMYPGQF